MTIRFAAIYVLLALVATATNIAGQSLVFLIYDGRLAITTSIAAGTALGLIVKYILDKRYIFRFRTRNAVHDGKTFILYVLMGLATTTIFWGIEFSFHYLFGTKNMRYIGGIIGLCIGYFIKYHLDKRYVFLDREGSFNCY